MTYRTDWRHIYLILTIIRLLTIRLFLLFLKIIKFSERERERERERESEIHLFVSLFDHI